MRLDVRRSDTGNSMSAEGIKNQSLFESKESKRTIGVEYSTPFDSRGKLFARSLDPEPAHAINQGGARNSEPCGRAARTPEDIIRFAQHLQDVLPFHFP